MTNRSVDASTLAPPSAATTRGDTFTKDDELKKDNTYVLSDTEDGEGENETQLDSQSKTENTDQNPDATVQNPDATVQNPDATDQNPGATEQNPGAPGQNSDATDQNLGATNQNPDATDQNPDATEQNPGAPGQNSDATDQNLGATIHNPDATDHAETEGLNDHESENQENPGETAMDENQANGETNAGDQTEGNASSEDDNVNKDEGAPNHSATNGTANGGKENAITNQEEAVGPEVETAQEAAEGEKDNTDGENAVTEDVSEEPDKVHEKKNGERSRNTWLEKPGDQNENTDGPSQADEGAQESEQAPVENAAPDEIHEDKAADESQTDTVPVQNEETDQVSDPNDETAEQEQKEDVEEVTGGINDVDTAVREGDPKPTETVNEQENENETGQINGGDAIDDHETDEKVAETNDDREKADVDGDDTNHVRTPSPRHGDEYVPQEDESRNDESEDSPKNEGIPEIVVQKADTQSTLKTQSEKSRESLKASYKEVDDSIHEKDCDDDDHSRKGEDCDWDGAKEDLEAAPRDSTSEHVNERDNNRSGTDSRAEEPALPKSPASSGRKSGDDQTKNGDADVESVDSINLSQHSGAPKSDHGSPPDTSRSEYLLESMHSNAHYILDSVHTVRKENQKMKEENDKLRAEKSSLRAELKKLKREADNTKKELNERIMELEGDLNAALERINKFESLVLDDHHHHRSYNSKRTSKTRRRRQDSTESSGQSSQASPDLGRRGLRVSPEIHMHVHGPGLSADANAQSASVAAAASASLEQYLKIDIRRLEEYNETLKRSLEQEIEKRSMVQKLLEEVMETNEAFKSQFEKWQKSTVEHEELKKEYAELEQKYKNVMEANMNMNVALLELQPSDKPLLPSLKDKFSSKTGDLISRIEAAEVELRDSKRRVSSLEDYLRNLYSGELKIKFSPSNGDSDRPIFTLPDIDEKKKRVDVNGPHNAYSVMARKRKFKK